jgi:integrase
MAQQIENWMLNTTNSDLEQTQLGHASVQTTERYLATEQNPARAVNDTFGLDMG